MLAARDRSRGRHVELRRNYRDILLLHVSDSGPGVASPDGGARVADGLAASGQQFIDLALQFKHPAFAVDRGRVPAPELLQVLILLQFSLLALGNILHHSDCV